MSVIGAALRLAGALRDRGRRRYLLEVVHAMSGVHPRRCNLCGFAGRFLAAGHPPRYDARCPGCASLERHRLFGLLLAARPDLGRGRVVHFAPEPVLRRALRQRASDYRSADALRDDCDLTLDLTRIDLPDESVDLFVLNHVLEHVADDRAALSELHRCLAPGGAALISVPMVEGWAESYEDEAIAAADDPTPRILHFGQGDHVRFYGADLVARIAAAGFSVEPFTGSGADTVEYGLIRGEKIFIATRTGR